MAKKKAAPRARPAALEPDNESWVNSWVIPCHESEAPSAPRSDDKTIHIHPTLARLRKVRDRLREDLEREPMVKELAASSTDELRLQPRTGARSSLRKRPRP